MTYPAEWDVVTAPADLADECGGRGDGPALAVSPAHLEHLRTSGLTDATIADARLRTVRDGERIANLLGWKRWGKRNGSVLAFPYFPPGETAAAFCRVRPTRPIVFKREDGEKDVRKYVQPSGVPLIPYFAPMAVADRRLLDVTRPCVWLEGEKKLLLVVQLGHAAVGGAGVDCFHDAMAKKSGEARRLHPLALEHVALGRGRRHVLLFDNDAHSNPEVMEAARRLTWYLRQAGANGEIILATPPPGDAKGVDDLYVARGGGDAGAAAVAALIDGPGVALEPLEPRRPKRQRAKGQPKKAQPPHPSPADITDVELSDRLVKAADGELRFCDELGGWFEWAGTHWQRDRRKRHRELAKSVAKDLAREAAETSEKRLFDAAKRAGSASGVSGLLKLAESAPQIIFTADDVDRDPWLLNCANGTLNLRTGDLRPHRREDLITKVSPAPFRPDAAAPTFESFLEEIQPDPEVRSYLARLFGYAAIGAVREHVLGVFWGPGANGKSVLAECVRAALGEYAKPGPSSLIVQAGNHEVHPTDVASCLGSRLVLVHETKKGAVFDASKVKVLTGGDQLTARYMHQDFITFDPTHTLLMLSNYKPELDGGDSAIWRRIQLVPFDVVIPKERQDRDLAARIKASELDGVLRWIVEGAVEWQRRGLDPPAAVLKQTAAYRDDENAVFRFLRSCCLLNPDLKTQGSVLFEAFRAWCDDDGARAGNPNQFAKELRALGYGKTTRGGRVFYCGIGLTADTQNDPRAYAD